MVFSCCWPTGSRRQFKHQPIEGNLKTQNHTGCLPCFIFCTLQCLPIIICIMYIYIYIPVIRKAYRADAQDNRLLSDDGRVPPIYKLHKKSIWLTSAHCWLWSARGKKNSSSKWRNWPRLICDLWLGIGEATYYMGKISCVKPIIKY